MAWPHKVQPLPGGRVLVLAPHPDDETLGCGGSLLRHHREGSEIHWLIATRMTAAVGFDAPEIARRDEEIARVKEAYSFSSASQLPFGASTLDSIPLGDLIQAVGEVIDKVEPNVLYLPFPYDAHSDHRRCFRAGSACSKWFRRPYLRHVLAYEVPSETGFNLDPSAKAFRPNWYVPIDDEILSRKVEIMKIYQGEMAPFPFPRSPESLAALARLRGSECGSTSAEGFVLLRSSW